MQFPATLVQLAEKPPLPSSQQGKILRLHLSISCNFGSACRKVLPPTGAKQGNILRVDLSISCNFQQLWFSWQKSLPPHFPPFHETQLVSHMCNTHGPHTTNPHSDSSYPNILFRLPTLSTFQNTHI